MLKRDRESAPSATKRIAEEPCAIRIFTSAAKAGKEKKPVVAGRKPCATQNHALRRFSSSLKVVPYADFRKQFWGQALRGIPELIWISTSPRS
jgi:hypothetical protein